MSQLAQLCPTTRRRVYDLVQEAGIDVSDWANYAEGRRPPAANPRYCYEWAFAAPNQVVVLNVWHRDMVEANGVITLQANLRAQARRYSELSGKFTWKRRSERLDEAVRLAESQMLPVRAIVLDGRQRKHSDLESKASQVRFRALDPVPWAVTSYDDSTGEFTITRGALPGRLVDQFSAGAEAPDPTERRDATGKVFVRSPLVRQHVLARAAGRCESCGQYGFTTPDGSVFLETHHVVPLSEGGPDTVGNVVAICANHHREAHHGAARMTIREQLLAYLRGDHIAHVL